MANQTGYVTVPATIASTESLSTEFVTGGRGGDDGTANQTSGSQPGGGSGGYGPSGGTGQ